MKRLIIFTFTVLVIVISVFMISCGECEEHSYGEWTVTKTATCSEEGVREHTCSECFNTESEKIPKIAHTEVIDAAVAATCTTKGLTEGKHCSVCNTITVARTEVAATGHTEVTDEAIAATCAADGLTEGKHCSVCNTVLVAQTKINKLNHENFDDVVVAPTCLEDGFTIHTCEECGFVEIDTFVDAYTHDFAEYISDNNATYEANGTKTSVCANENCEATHTVEDANTKLYDYTVTYVSKFGDMTFKTEAITKCFNSSIEYTAPEFLGYKFVGWSDGETEAQRTDDVSEDGTTLVANYEIDYLEMPVIWIVTENYQGIYSKEDYVNCTVSILNTDEEFCLDEVTAGIRGRGNTTWGFDKKPYRIKFDSKQSLFGSSYKQKSWTLIANYQDLSLSRNAIAYELGEKFDGIEFSSMHQFVEVYLNGEYRGVYLLCDQIQTGSGRVDVDEELYEDGDTGYLIELDGRAPSEGVLNIDYFTINNRHYAIKTPDTEDDEYNPEIYVSYIKTYFEDCLDAIKNGTWEEVCELIDVNSFVDTYIIQELLSNVDFGFSSSYFYKDRGGKLFSGPLWDFDIAGGNHNFAVDGADKEWDPTLYLYATNHEWFGLLCEHQEFVDLIVERLDNNADKILETISYLSPINEDGYYKTYEKSLERNFVKWTFDENNSKIWNLNEMLDSIDSVRYHQLYLRDWLLARYYYLQTVYN